MLCGIIKVTVVGGLWLGLLGNRLLLNQEKPVFYPHSVMPQLPVLAENDVDEIDLNPEAAEPDEAEMLPIGIVVVLLIVVMVLLPIGGLLIYFWKKR